MNNQGSKFVGSQFYKDRVKLLLVYPTPPPGDSEGPFEIVPRPQLFPTTHVDETYCRDAPASYDGANAATNAKKAVPLVVAKAKWAEQNGYDAVVVACMVDPGVAEAKKAANIPVIGIGESSQAIASLIGIKAERIGASIPVSELADDEEKTCANLRDVSQWLVAKRGADVLIPNCAYIGGLAHRLQSELGVPALPTVDMGLK